MESAGDGLEIPEGGEAEDVNMDAPKGGEAKDVNMDAPEGDEAADANMDAPTIPAVPDPFGPKSRVAAVSIRVFLLAQFPTDNSLAFVRRIPMPSIRAPRVPVRGRRSAVAVVGNTHHKIAYQH